jgi:hypothetical protein
MIFSSFRIAVNDIRGYAKAVPKDIINVTYCIENDF